MTAFRGEVAKLPPSSLVNFVGVLGRNNFGEAQLLLEVNRAILNRRKELTPIDMSMLMACLYELDRVTIELDELFRDQILNVSV